jgi:hypothetical protein
LRRCQSSARVVSRVAKFIENIILGAAASAWLVC